MMAMPIADHPQRYALTNELHARPFPTIAAPGRAAYLALKPASQAAARDREADRRHLIALLDRHGAPHPQPGATHWFGDLGRHHLKWESHTEFVTYTMVMDGLDARPFDPAAFDVFPDDWLATAPGTRIASALIRIEERQGDAGIAAKADDWFVAESLALSRVLDDELVVGTDFRIDPAGHLRIAVWAAPGISDRRIGRVVTRLCEVETYKTMAMLGLSRARDLGPKMGRTDRDLTALMADMSGDMGDPDRTLHALLTISSELENMIAQSSFRFGASCARCGSKAARPSPNSCCGGSIRRCGPCNRRKSGCRRCRTGRSGRPNSCAPGSMSNGRRRTRRCSPAWTAAPTCNCGCSARSRGCRWWRSAIMR
jgi:uncharacterized membrane-anchored protein